MAGRISEYIPTTKITDTDLMDISVVDAGSASGYVTRRTTVSELINFHPSIYTDNGTLVGDRTVFQDDNTIYFNGGDFGLDSLNDGFKYEDLTKRVGIGTDTPLASTHIKGQSGDELLLLQDSLGFNRMIVNENGNRGVGIGTNATVLAGFGSWSRSAGNSVGHAFYGYNGTQNTVAIQHVGDQPNPIALNVGFQGGHNGKATSIKATTFPTSLTTEAIGFEGLSRNGSSKSIGIRGVASAGGNIPSLLYSCGVEGFCSSGLDNKHLGGFFHSVNSGSVLYTKENIGIDAIGESNKFNQPLSSNITKGGNFRTLTTSGLGDSTNISICSPLSNNDGVVVFGQDNRQGDAILQTTGGVRMQGLPTSAAGLLAGELWNDAGTLKIA